MGKLYESVSPYLQAGAEGIGEFGNAMAGKVSGALDSIGENQWVQSGGRMLGLESEEAIRSRTGSSSASGVPEAARAYQGDKSYDSGSADYLSKDFKGTRTKEQQKEFDEEMSRQNIIGKTAAGILGGALGGIAHNEGWRPSASSKRVSSSSSGGSSGGRLGMGKTYQDILSMNRRK